MIFADRIRGRVVVITGGSKGIGRAAAHAFARRGARLVLAARGEPALAATVDECRALRAEAVAVAVDVGTEAGMLALRNRAIAHFGCIDVWINNAAVTTFGRFEDIPAADHERVLRTNLLAAAHAASAVMPYFRARGRGVFIIVSSVVALVSQPFTGMYCASKFGLRGLAGSLRQEVGDVPGIRVCTLLPASIDTPVFAAGANYSGRAVRPLRPVYTAHMVAADLVALAERPQRERVSGPVGRLVQIGGALAPGLAERVVNRQVRRGHFRDRPACRTPGTVHAPSRHPAAVSGGWRGRRPRSTKAIVLGVGATALAVALAWRAVARVSWARRQ